MEKSKKLQKNLNSGNKNEEEIKIPLSIYEKNLNIYLIVKGKPNSKINIIQSLLKIKKLIIF